MGLYTTTTSIEARMVEVDFDAKTLALCTEMISDAESEINKYLSRRYDLGSLTFQTSTSIPPIVRSMCNRLTEGYMWKNMSRGSKESLSRGNSLVKDVIDNLTLIANYKADILNTSGSLLTDMSNTAYRVLCNTTNYSNTFGEDSDLNWAVDSDKITDISTERD